MRLEQLPPKGVKREQAILELGKDEANGELLFQLVNTEKNKCKTAAQKALAQLEYAPAAPLWAKLVKGKWMGRFRLRIGADCPSYSKDSLPAAGRGRHKATGYRTTELLFPFDVGESLAKNAGGLPLSGGKHPADRPIETHTCLF